MLLHTIDIAIAIAICRKPTQRPHSTAATTTTSSGSKPIATTPPAPIIQVQNGGILSNILQTAAGVAVGHTVGRLVSGLFEGNGNSDSSAVNSQSQAQAQAQTPIQCQGESKRFLDCMSQNYDDVAACQSYLEMMRQCQRQFA